MRTPFSQKLARLDVDALIVEGSPSDKSSFWLLKITAGALSYTHDKVRWGGLV